MYQLLANGLISPCAITTDVKAILVVAPSGHLAALCNVGFIFVNLTKHLTSL